MPLLMSARKREYSARHYECIGENEMTGTFSVKNFAKFQHYKKRRPPWIKLYNELLDDYKFGRLPDASKAHLIAIWLLASCYENKIPADKEWVARRINATSPIDFLTLINDGFIEADQECSKMLADCKQNAPLETETETEKEVKKVDTSYLPKKVVLRGTRLSEDWKPKDHEHELAMSFEWTEADYEDRLVEFHNYWMALPGSKALKLNWDQTWNNRIRDIYQRKKVNGYGRHTKPTNIDNLALVRAKIEEAERLGNSPFHRETGGNISRLLEGPINLRSRDN